MRATRPSLLPLCLLIGPATPQAAGGGARLGRLPTGERFAAGELVVGVDSAALRPGIDALFAEMGARVTEEIPELRTLRVALGSGTDERQAVARLAACPGVAFAELNGVVEEGCEPPDDTFFADQWQLDNTGQGGGLPGADIDALRAWRIERGSPSVVVAVLDSGIDFDHPEFRGRLLGGYDFVDEDPKPKSNAAHGIRISGLVAARADNDFGVSGVDQHCKLLPIRVTNNGIGFTFDVAQGLRYAADEDADVVVMSLVNAPQSAALLSGLDYAADKGVILIACAGNGGIGNADESWPGASPRTISIGNSTRDDVRAGSSATGNRLDFLAPGKQAVTVALHHGDDFSMAGGCSAATPVAAGIVTLLKAHDPSLDHAAVYELLRAGAEDQIGDPAQDTPGWDPFYGHGRLNAFRSLCALVGQIGDSYCVGAPNSVGAGARLLATGSSTVAANDLRLCAVSCPPGVTGFFYFGPSPLDVPFGEGRRCVGGPVRLVQPGATDHEGSADVAVDLTVSAAGASAVPGSAVHFQFWYRDPGGGPSGFNLTDALSVTWN